MVRAMIVFALLVVGALAPSRAVQALSAPDMSSVAGGNASLVQVAKMSKCDKSYKKCSSACKKDEICIAVCVVDRDLCKVF